MMVKQDFSTNIIIKSILIKVLFEFIKSSNLVSINSLKINIKGKNTQLTKKITLQFQMKKI